MILITSGAYVKEELSAEFGDIPPCFLPFANRPLILHQIELLAEKFPGEQIFLSLPNDFQLQRHQAATLEAHGISVIEVPASISLGNSVLIALNIAGKFDESIRILHGDTLILDPPIETDAIATGIASHQYSWQEASENSVWAGFFAFSRTADFVRELAIAGDFVLAVKNYKDLSECSEHRVDQWSDFGHINTYYDARKKLTTERNFNQIKMTGGLVAKTGQPIEKIAAESKWFERLPLYLKPFAPAFYGHQESQESFTYFLEYLAMAPLNELFVHGRHEAAFWTRILGMYEDWFTNALEFGQSEESEINLAHIRETLVSDKTHTRLESFSDQTGFDLNREITINGKQLCSVAALAQLAIENAMALNPIPALVHGDICFSNSLYDSRNGRLRFLDPRGIPDDKLNAVGDLRYDIAKLAHSIAGHYDLIVAGNFFAEERSDYSYDFEIFTNQTQELLAKQFFGGELFHDRQLKLASSVSRADTVLLFLSMLPLHSDRPDRQLAFILNAFRLWFNLD